MFWAHAFNPFYLIDRTGASECTNCHQVLSVKQLL